jgi:hypothetical protein
MEDTSVSGKIMKLLPDEVEEKIVWTRNFHSTSVVRTVHFIPIKMDCDVTKKSDTFSVSSLQCAFDTLLAGYENGKVQVCPVNEYTIQNEKLCKHRG